MSQGKGIEIKMVATGADAAAAEVRKVEAAVDAAAQTGASAEGLRDLGAAAGEAAQQSAQLAENLSEASEGAGEMDKNVENIARAQKAQAISDLAGHVGKIGSKFKEVADEVEVFDAELAATLRNTGENIEKVSGGVSMIAMGFAQGGPAGAGAAALGVGINLLVDEYIGAGQAAVEMEATTAAAFEGMVNKLGDVAAAKEKLETESWVTTLAAEEEGIRLQNEELQRNRTLLEGKLAAQAKLDAAKADKAIAEIDADDSLSEEEKIRRKAAVREGHERSKVESSVNAEGRKVEAAEKNAAAKAAEAKRLADDAAEIEKNREATAQELQDQERKQKAKERAAAALPAAAAAAATATKNAELQRRNPFFAEGRQQEAENAQSHLEDLRNKAYSDPGGAVKADELRAKKQALEAAATKAKEDAENAAREANRLGLDAAAGREAFESGKATTTETYQTEAEARRIRTEAAAGGAAKRKADAEARAAEQAQSRAEAAAARNNTEAGRAGKDAEKLLPAGVAKKFRDAVEKVSAGLQDGDQGGELEELAKLMNNLASAVQVKGTKTEVEISQLRKTMAVLQAQIKNGRNGK